MILILLLEGLVEDVEDDSEGADDVELADGAPNGAFAVECRGVVFPLEIWMKME